MIYPKNSYEACENYSLIFIDSVKVNMSENIWILSSVRSGSWFLCDLLNQTTNFEFIEKMHWNNPNRCIYPATCKVLRRHFLSLHSDKSKKKIENKLKNIKYIWLHRKDNYARAVSLYFSLISNIWKNSLSNKKNKFLECQNNLYPFFEDLILKCYWEVSSKFHNDWDNYLNTSNYLYVNYDDLILDTKITLQKILNYLNIKTFCQYKINSMPMKRIQTNEFIQRLMVIANKKNHYEIITKSDLDVYAKLREAFVLKCKNHFYQM